METLVGLPLVESLTKPIPDAVTQFYQSGVAKGSGEFGTYTMYDFMGSGAGVTTTNNMQNVVQTIGSMDTSGLLTVYVRMVNTINGIYDVEEPVPGVKIPPGPGEGFYENRNKALSQGLIPAANSAIAGLTSTYSSQCFTLNNSFNAICNRYVYEYNNQQRAGLNWPDLAATSNQSTISFMAGLGAAGVDRVTGGQSDFISALADTSKQSGQAILGALREGRNNEAMDKA